MKRLPLALAATFLGMVLSSGSIWTADPNAVHTSAKDPTTAVVWSLLFPGAGQYYTEQYWKIPLFSGAALSFAWLAYTNHDNMKEAQGMYDDAVARGEESFRLSLYVKQRESYRDARDLNIALIAVTWIVAAIDSYVGAHLFEFSMSDDVAITWHPTVRPWGPGISASLSF